MLKTDLSLAMKNASLLLLLAVLGLAGCARRYVVTLSHGPALTVKGKPRFDSATDCFVCKDATGRRFTVPAGNVREIAPASMSSQLPTAPLRVSPRR